MRIHCCKRILHIPSAVIIAIIVVLVGPFFIISWVRENAVIIIALAALVFTILQGMRQRTYARLSVRPILQINRHFAEMPGISHFGIFLNNQGVGIAIIDELNISITGVKLKENTVSDEGSILARIAGTIRADYPDFPLIYYYAFLASGSALAPNTELALFTVKASLLTPALNLVLQNYISRMAIHIEYSSLYNEHFVYENKHPPRSI